MDEKKLKRYEDLLITKRKGLQDCLESLNEAAKPVDLGTPIGRLSRVDAMQHQQLKLETKRKTELSLAQIELALKRITEGKYGICIKCENEIADRRLTARPETLLCIDCQESLAIH